MINYRLNVKNKNSTIIAYDITVNNKCSKCSKFQPWILLKNSGEGCFLLKKVIEKTKPWNTCYIQENLYDLDNLEQCEDPIFVLITNIKTEQELKPLEKLYDIIQDFEDCIINSDIRIKNRCFDCEVVSPWLIIRNNERGIEFVKHLTKNYQPFIILKKQKIFYDHNIPKEIKGLKKWTLKEQMRFGNMKIKI